ncbi:MAG: OmpH family outer membrane protein [Opitutae bacterium]|jgi:outer membrane protein|nr:OmpH family outer membrane protein [Opitutae bacterium]
MNTLLKNLLILTFTVLTINAGSIATVDEQKVLSEYVAFNQAREKVLASVAPIQEEIQKMQEEITGIIAEAREADATSNNPALDEDARDEARSKLVQYQTTLQNKQVQLQQFSQQAQELGQNGQQQELIPLQQKAQDAVKEIAEKEGIDIVLSTNSVIFVEESLDISDKVISELNK